MLSKETAFLFCLCRREGAVERLSIHLLVDVGLQHLFGFDQLHHCRANRLIWAVAVHHGLQALQHLLDHHRVLDLRGAAGASLLRHILKT